MSRCCYWCVVIVGVIYYMLMNNEIEIVRVVVERCICPKLSLVSLSLSRLRVLFYDITRTRFAATIRADIIMMDSSNHLNKQRNSRIERSLILRIVLYCILLYLKIHLSLSLLYSHILIVKKNGNILFFKGNISLRVRTETCNLHLISLFMILPLYLRYWLKILTWLSLSLSRVVEFI